jgi:hypothetical protein
VSEQVRTVAALPCWRSTPPALSANSNAVDRLVYFNFSEAGTGGGGNDWSGAIGQRFDAMPLRDDDS